MKRYKNWVRAAMLLLLTMLTSNGTWADTKVTVWLNDGTKTDVLQVVATDSIKETDLW